MVKLMFAILLSFTLLVSMPSFSSSKSDKLSCQMIMNFALCH